MTEITIKAGKEEFNIPVPGPEKNHKHIAAHNLAPIIISADKLDEYQNGVFMHKDALVANDLEGIGSGCYIGAAAIGSHVAIGSGSLIGDGAEIGHGCVLGTGVVIAPGVSIAPNTVIGKNVIIRENTKIIAGMDAGDYSTTTVGGRQAFIDNNVFVGQRNRFYGIFNVRGNSCIGDDNKFQRDARTGWEVIITDECSFDISAYVGNHCQIGPGSRIGFLARLDDAVKIKSRGLIGNYADIGLGVKLGDGVEIAPRTLIAPEAVVGNKVTMGNNVHIGRLAKIGASCALNTDVKVAAATKVPAKTVLGTGEKVTPKTKFGPTLEKS